MAFRTQHRNRVPFLVCLLLTIVCIAKAQTPTSAPATTTPAVDPIAAKLTGAKIEQKSALSHARRALLKSIDSRLDSAADVGDLPKVKVFQAARSMAEKDGNIPEEMTDATVLSAKKTCDAAVRAANDRLVTAYKAAIHDYTRARQFTQAQAVQDELNTIGQGESSSTAAGADSAPTSIAAGSESTLKQGPMTRLGHSLPSFLVGGEFSSDGSGIVLNSPIQSRATDLLSKDFIFDVECDRRDHGAPLFVGLAEGIGANGPKTTAIKIYPTQEGGGGYVALTNNDENGDEVGHLPEPGKCLIRVEKIGRSVIFSVGVVEEGKFIPQLSRAVVDIHTFNPELHDGSTHLYIRGGKGISLTGAALSIGAITAANQPIKELPLGNFPLQRLVPGFLDGATYNLTPDGLMPRNARWQSINHAVLTKDFTCDVTFTYHKRGIGWFGIGEAGTGDRPEKFIGIRIQEGDAGHQVFYFNHSVENGENLAETTEPGNYIVRMTKQGHELNFSVGADDGPEFKPIASKIISDLSSYDSDLNATNTHLFIGGSVVYNNIALSAPIVKPVPPAAPAVPIAAAPTAGASVRGAAPTTSALNPAADNAFSGWYCIVNKKTGHYLFVTSDNKNQGNWITVKAANDSDNEKWSLNSLVGSEYLKLVNKYSKKTVSVRAGSKSAGTDIIEWNEWKAGRAYAKPCEDNWKIEKAGDYFKIVSEISGQCLSEDSGKDHQAVQQPWKSGDDQLWRIESVK